MAQLTLQGVVQGMENPPEGGWPDEPGIPQRHKLKAIILVAVGRGEAFRFFVPTDEAAQVRLGNPVTIQVEIGGDQ